MHAGCDSHVVVCPPHLFSYYSDGSPRCHELTGSGEILVPPTSSLRAQILGPYWDIGPPPWYQGSVNKLMLSLHYNWVVFCTGTLAAAQWRRVGRWLREGVTLRPQNPSQANGHAICGRGMTSWHVRRQHTARAYMSSYRRAGQAQPVTVHRAHRGKKLCAKS